MAFGWSKVFSALRSGLWRVVTLAVPDVFMPCSLIWAGLAVGAVVDGLHDQLVGAFVEDGAGVESGPVVMLGGDGEDAGSGVAGEDPLDVVVGRAVGAGGCRTRSRRASTARRRRAPSNGGNSKAFREASGILLQQSIRGVICPRVVPSPMKSTNIIFVEVHFVIPA